MEGGVTPFSSGMAPSGSYILIVVSQPLNEEHKQIILQRLNQGLLSWDVSSTGCDLSGLEYAFSANIKDSVTESDVLIQHSTESLGVEVLLSPTVRTLKQCVRNLLSTPTCHKQLIHAGYTFAGSGSWILENGTFSFEEFLEIFEQANVQSQKRCTINVHCTEEGQWSQANFSKDILTKCADVSLNPSEKVNHVPGSENLIKCLENALTTQTTEDMMKPSPLVGNIRFNRPTIYMFPAGQGDCALFGINGFNMLIDGGFHRKPCSWDFIRHLDRLDAVLVTRIGESNVCGMSTLMRRNATNNANPQIGYVFCNIAENKSSPSKDGSVEAKNDLIVSVVGEGHTFVQTLNDLKLKPHQCWRDSSIDPFVLYHKVGQGTLEMHVLSPPRDSKEMKQFLSEWNAYKETFSGVKSEMKGVEKMIPLSHATSICAILVWRPEDPKDTITRILFPGSAPQNKILEGLEKLKVLNILNQPVVTKASLNIPSSKVISSKVEKSISRTSIPNRNNTASPVLSVSSVASRNGDIGGHKKEIKKVTKEVKKEVKEIKKEVKKDVKKDIVSKDVKKDIKVESSVKKDLTKKDSTKDVKKEVKDVKKIIKKESKEIKATNDKKPEVKSTLKKESTTPTAKSTTEVKKTSAVKKSTPPVKKDVGKPPTAPKENGTKKTVSKISEPKAAKDVSNKKTVETKTVAKAKPKSAAASPKTTSTPKTKPVAVPKPGSKMTKAVAASSIVASAVAVTVAAFELNEKKETIEETEPEISEKEIEINGETKEIANGKSVDDVVSPLPPEVLSPTPSDSVSLTPSDTLSSAPLETVSPTPPLPNEPISTEEKEVNEIKELEQDMPFEHGKEVDEEAQNMGTDDLKSENEVNDIEVELAKHQASDDVMSTSFVADKQYDDKVEEHFEKTELVVTESVPSKLDIENECLSEKDVTEEKDVAEDKEIEEEKYETGEKDIDDEKDIADEKDSAEESDSENEEICVDKNIAEVAKKAHEEFEEDEENDASEDKESVKSNDIYEDKDSAVEKEKEEPVEKKVNVESEDLTEEKDIIEEKDVIEEKYVYEEKYATQEHAHGEEKDVVEEKHILETGETSGEKDLFGEKYDSEDKHTSDKEDNTIENEIKNAGFENTYGDNEYETMYGEDTKEIDDQLAGLTMEGSYCAGMISTEKEGSVTESHFTHISENNDISHDETFKDDSKQEINVIEEQFEKKTISETESHYGSEIIEDKTVHSEYSHESFEAHAMESTPEVNKEDEIQHSTDYQSSFVLSDRTDELGDEKNEQESLDKNEKQPDNYENTDPEKFAESSELHFDRFSQMQSMEQSFHQDAYENYENITNIDDLDMQETSVDEPEDIVRKESVVSITLNDDNLEEPYIDSYRRKSGTESEDDVDIGKYMCKEEQAAEGEKLHVQRGSDSDEEDVVKSPTPHAVVDYEGQLDDLTSADEKSKVMDSNDKHTIESKEAYMNEKDVDEKDRDSAEDQESDDGEMIRHPTPPEIKYSEEEMRDPIGPHFITNPSLKVQGSDITDQPLYEEAEDSGSERSVSPIIEQPVFGNVVQADFPELVTVSGGTTPSEPQSPKGSFDNKKIPSESTVMEALSEHDISESSTHSPSCQDGSTAFDLQVSDRSVIEVQSLKDEEIISNEMLKKEDKSDLSLSNLVASEPEINTKLEESSNAEQNVHDDKEDNQEDKKDSPSDEEESSSEDENSESHSKDKSDAMGDKSDVERDDRSDIHNDDRSDHHYDKSDVVNDDDDKSDIHEDEHSYRQQSQQLETEMEDVVQKDLKSDFKDEFGESYNSPYSIRYDNEYTPSDDLKNNYETTSNTQNHPDFNYDSGILKEENNSHCPSSEAVEESIDAERHTGSDKIEGEETETENFPSFEKVNMQDYLQNTQDPSFEKVNMQDYLQNTQDPSFEKVNMQDYLQNTLNENASRAGSTLDYESSTKSDNYEYESHYERLGDAKELSDYDSTTVQSARLDEAENIDKDDHGESPKTFQKDEANFENSKSSSVFCGYDSSNYQIESEKASVNPDSGALVENISEISKEMPLDFGNKDDINLGQHEEELIKNQAKLDESFYSSQNTSTVENKLLTDMDNVHKYEEEMHTHSEIYSASTLGEGVTSCDEQRLTLEENTARGEKDIEDLTTKIKSFSDDSTYEYSSATTTNTFSGVTGYEIPDSFNNTNIMKESYTEHSYDKYGEGNTADGFNSADSYKPMNENYSHLQEHTEFMQNETAFMETLSKNEVTSEHIGDESTNIMSKNSFTSEITGVNCNDKENKSSVDAQEFPLVNGKEQASSSLPSSDITAEFIRTELTNNESFTTTNQQSDPESGYLTSNRFHSDSPEDNTMRSDSSPDVPYPVSVTEKFSELKNSMSIETCSESYINSEDFKNNMNFSGTDGISLSQPNHSLNANQNNTYTESSDDEGNSLVRGNVSPYAYTNKAYSREEEDIDGNHIYKEETTEVIKQVEFDGNNLQNVSTNQVSSVMNYSQEYQDVQYSSGANYDFRLEEWGKPMGLPTPPDSSQKTLTKKSEKTVVKSKTSVDANGKVHSPSVSSKLSSPLKKPKPKVAKESSSSPVYVDLAYVPQHADPNYCDVEFFKKIRARYYVISSVNPSKEVLNALLEAKKTWNEDLSVTIIPTYETDTLGYWMAQNQNDLAEYSIDVSPSASRCTVNLQDHQTSCSAYRLEF